MIPEPVGNAQARPQLTAFRRGCGVQEQDEPENVMRAPYTAAQRKAAPKALGTDYPIGDIEHGRKVVQLSTHESPKNRAKILAAVHRRFPSIEIGGK